MFMYINTNSNKFLSSILSFNSSFSNLQKLYPTFSFGNSCITDNENRFCHNVILHLAIEFENKLMFIRLL